MHVALRQIRFCHDSRNKSVKTRMTDFESNLAKRCKCRGTERTLITLCLSTVVTNVMTRTTQQNASSLINMTPVELEELKSLMVMKQDELKLHNQFTVYGRTLKLIFT